MAPYFPYQATLGALQGVGGTLTSLADLDLKRRALESSNAVRDAEMRLKTLQIEGGNKIGLLQAQAGVESAKQQGAYRTLQALNLSSQMTDREKRATEEARGNEEGTLRDLWFNDYTTKKDMTPQDANKLLDEQITIRKEDTPFDKEFKTKLGSLYNIRTNRNRINAGIEWARNQANDLIDKKYDITPLTPSQLFTEEKAKRGMQYLKEHPTALNVPGTEQEPSKLYETYKEKYNSILSRLTTLSKSEIDPNSDEGKRLIKDMRFRGLNASSPEQVQSYKKSLIETKNYYQYKMSDSIGDMLDKELSASEHAGEFKMHQPTGMKFYSDGQNWIATP